MPTTAEGISLISPKFSIMAAQRLLLAYFSFHYYIKRHKIYSVKKILLLYTRHIKVRHDVFDMLE